jgi:uncharacterized protein (TIGR00251 family)
MSESIIKTENGVLVRLYVLPKANKTGLAGYDKWRHRFKFKTTSPPIEGKANESVLDFFESLLGKKVKLAGGQKSIKKKILVLDATLDEISDVLKKQ